MSEEMQGKVTMDLRQSVEAIRDLHAKNMHEPAKDIGYQILRQKPDSPEILHLTAVSEIMSGRPELGISLLNKAAQLEPKNPSHLRTLASAFKALNRLTEAYATLERAVGVIATQPQGLDPVQIGKRSPSHHLQARPANIARFRKNKALSELTEMVYASGMYHVDDLCRLYAMSENIARVMSRGVKGDLAELGVWKGHSLKALKMLVPGRMVYAFDTFTGAPAGSFAEQDARAAAFRDTSLAEVQNFVGKEQVVWCPGTFPDSALGLPDDLRFSVVHLDAGTKAATQAGLDFFYPRLNSGGLMMIHDYANDSWSDVAVVADAFMADKPENILVMADKGGTGMFFKV